MIFDNEKSLCKTNQKIIVSQENGRKNCANNVDSNKVFQYKIDGDIVRKNAKQQRCDYIVENEDKKSAYLIELKGTDVEHAIDQVVSSINQFEADLKGYNILPRIIYRPNSHAIKNSSKIRAFKRNYPKSKIETNIITENI